jgi:hypothetical protein
MKSARAILLGIIAAVVVVLMLLATLRLERHAAAFYETVPTFQRAVETGA